MTSSFKDIMIEERPRERLLKYGVENISNEDLISIILKTGTKDLTVKDLAVSIIREIKDIKELRNMTISKLTKIKGIGPVKALEIISAIELGKRVYYIKSENTKKIKSSNDVFKIMKDKFIGKEKEHFYVIYLDTKSKIIDVKLLFVGTINSCIIDISEIFKHAYLLGASYFICIHNHPTGDVNPSKNDNINTVRLIKVGKLQNIFLKDHVIIGNNNYYSYRENSDFVF